MYFNKNPAYKRHWISRCVRISPVSCQLSHVTCHLSHVTCHLSHFTCHLSPTPTATATDHPPSNSPTMHSRLVHQDRNQTTTKSSKPKKILIKGVLQELLGFPIKSIRSSTRSRQLSWLQSPIEGKRNNTSTDGRPMNLMKCADCSTKTNKTNSHSQNNANSHRRGPSPC